MKKKASKRLNSYAWMLVNVVCWGAAFVAVKPALSVTTPTRFLLYRYAFAIVLSLPILIHYKDKLPKMRKLLPKLIGIELLGTTLALWLIYAGLQLSSAIEANLITMSLPVLITIGGILFLKEREEKREALGLGIAVLGTLLLVLTPLFVFGNGLAITSFEGNLLILLAMIINVAYYLLAKKHYHKYPLFLVTTLSFYVGFYSFIPLSIIEAGSITQFINGLLVDVMSPAVWIASGYMALFGSIIGLTAYYKGQDGIEASEAGLFTYLQPAVAIPLGVFLLGESVFGIQLLALGIILFGVYLAERRK